PVDPSHDAEACAISAALRWGKGGDFHAGDRRDRDRAARRRHRGGGSLRRVRRGGGNRQEGGEVSEERRDASRKGLQEANRMTHEARAREGGRSRRGGLREGCDGCL